MKCAPVTLFVYNRLGHTRRTIEALRQNSLAQESELFIFADAPREDSQIERVLEVREYIRHIEGFQAVTIVERDTNLGLARSIIDGVTAIVGKHGRIIVLEDDMVTSPHFLSYMNEALARYADEERVACIHAYLYPVDQPLPEAFFLPGADCWGWGTWRRGWACFIPDGQHLLDELKRRRLTRAFDFNGTYPYSEMLEGQIKGENDSWAIRWYASAFLAGKLTLYPGRSLVQNIGTDESGIHCGKSDGLDVELGQTPINLDGVVVESSQEGRDAFERFFRQRHASIRQRLTRKFRGLLAAVRK